MLLIRAKLQDNKRTYRDIAVEEPASLYDVAEFVNDAFGFAFDHCFGFFPSPDIFGKGKDGVHYELFVDIGEEHEENGRSVEETPASELWHAPKDKWWMLFDYGDDWVFELELIKISAKGKNGEVIKSRGEAPEQYPIPEEWLT